MGEVSEKRRLVNYVIFGTIIVLGIIVKIVSPSEDGENEITSQSLSPEELLESKIPSETQQLNWLYTLRMRCEEYDRSKNEIQASATFRKGVQELQQNLKNAKLSNVRGILKSISTSHGGYLLGIEIFMPSEDVYFIIKWLGDDGIKKGSKVYQQVSELKEDQCVVFSAIKINSGGMSEREQLCTDSFRANFSEIKPCPN